MKNTIIIKTGGFLLFLNSFGISYAQQKVVSTEQKQLLETRMTSFAPTKLIADSLLKAHATETYYFSTTGGMLEGALPVIFNYYSKAESYNRKCIDCKQLKDSIQQLIATETLRDMEREYQKILAKAEEYYLLGDFNKSKELYKRAITFKSNDPVPKDKWSFVDSIAQQGSVVYSEADFQRMCGFISYYVEKNDFEKARLFCERALFVHPADETVLKQKESLLNLQKR